MVNANNGAGSRGLLGLGFGLLKRFGALSPEQGADTTVSLATSAEVAGVSGRYFEERQNLPSGRESHDEAVARRLWEVSETLTGVPD